MQTLESAPACCLTDIPIRHLAYHAKRYGQFAIGFHRAAALQAGFNPVFYTLHDSAVMREIHEGFAKAGATSLEFSEMLLNELATITAEAELQEEVGASWRRYAVTLKTSVQHCRWPKIASLHSWRS